jgi:hypothetical protein
MLRSLHRSRSTIAAAAAVLGLGACTSTSGDSIGWRTPCNGTGSYEDQPTTFWQYQLDYDALGNLVFERESFDGTVNYTYAADYEGEALTREELDGEQGYLYTVDLQDGHRVFATYDDRSTGGTGDYTISWVWDEGRIVGWDADFADAASADLSASVTYQGAGFTQVLCAGAVCDTAEVEGEYDHWTRWRTDYNSDGVIDADARVTYDSNDLIVSYQRDALDSLGGLSPDVYSSWDREPDGTPLRYHWESFVDQPRRWLVVYGFCD